MCEGKRKEAPIGFEPMVADLQSAGLATCLRRLIFNEKSIEAGQNRQDQPDLP